MKTSSELALRPGQLVTSQIECAVALALAEGTSMYLIGTTEEDGQEVGVALNAIVDWRR